LISTSSSDNSDEEEENNIGKAEKGGFSVIENRNNDDVEELPTPSSITMVTPQQQE
jgi:hypothetical protein